VAGDGEEAGRPARTVDGRRGIRASDVDDGDLHVGSVRFR